MQDGLPKLEEPYYILDTPAPIRWVIVMLIVYAPPAGLVWLYANYRAGGLEFYHYFIGVILVLAIFTLFNRSLWRRRVSFAADCKGIYTKYMPRSDRKWIHIGNTENAFLFVPWAEVGDSSVGYAVGESSTGYAGVSDMTEKTVLRGKSKKFGIGSNLRNVEKTRENIEGIRRIAMTGTDIKGSK